MLLTLLLPMSREDADVRLAEVGQFTAGRKLLSIIAAIDVGGTRVEPGELEMIGMRLEPPPITSRRAVRERDHSGAGQYLIQPISSRRVGWGRDHACGVANQIVGMRMGREQAAVADQWRGGMMSVRARPGDPARQGEAGRRNACGAKAERGGCGSRVLQPPFCGAQRQRRGAEWAARPQARSQVSVSTGVPLIPGAAAPRAGLREEEEGRNGLGVGLGCVGVVTARNSRHVRAQC